MAIEKYSLSLEEAKRTLKIADRMIYFTLPIVKEKKFMIKILEELYNSSISLVKAVLQHEYINKKIHVYSDGQSNFESFEKCAADYGIMPEQVRVIKNIFNLIEKHKQSAMEFVRKDKYVILSDSLGMDFITCDTLKQYFFIINNVIQKTETNIGKKAH